MIEQLKLAKLPDRTPVKITITVSPDLNRMLLAYQAAYKAAYLKGDEEEAVAALIPFMIQSFLESDRNFVKVMRGNGQRSNVNRTRRAEEIPSGRTLRRQMTSSNGGDGPQS